MVRPGRQSAHARGVTRQALWTEMRKRKRFTVPQLCPNRVGLGVANHYLRALEAAGYVRRESLDSEREGGRYRAVAYVLARDIGVEAPRLRNDGSAVTQGLPREQLWRSMRILGEFNAIELCVTATTPAARVNETDVKRYLSRLHRAGYLHCVRPGVPGRLARYRLLASRNTGPRPPVVQASGDLYDPNLGRVVWRRKPLAVPTHTEDPADG